MRMPLAVLVLAAALWLPTRLDAQSNPACHSLPGPQSEGKALVAFEAFKVYGGEVHAVEAVFEGMPASSPSGWK